MKPRAKPDKYRWDYNRRETAKDYGPPLPEAKVVQMPQKGEKRE